MKEWWRLLASFRRIDVGDLLLFFYGAVCVRQFFWGVTSETLAWILTGFSTTVLWMLHLVSKPQETEKLSAWFYVIVGVPLLLLYCSRAAYPDFSWDVRSYHLFLAERGLRGPLFLPDDFFPGHHHFNPTPDMLTGLARWALGYRLGTILNFFVLLWCGQILFRLAADYFRNKALLCCGILAVLLCEQLLSQVHTYMIDLLALPLMLEATRVLLCSDPRARDRAEIIRFGVLLGLAVAMKLTLVILAVPLAVAYLLRKTVGHAKWSDGWLLLLGFVAFSLPLLPYSVYMYAYAGNPVLPFGNRFFQSPYAAVVKVVFDARFGPQGLIQTLLWPLLGHFQPERMGEAAAYSGRLLLANVAAILALVFWRKEPRLRLLSLILLGGTVLWSAMLMGYVRYAGYLELIGGLVVLEFCVLSFCALPTARVRGCVGALVLAFWMVQIGLALRITSKFDLGMRYSFGSGGTALSEPEAHWEAAGRVWRDRKLAAFLTRRDRTELAQAEAWIVSDPLVFGMQVLLKNQIPALGLWQPFPSEFARRQFLEKIDRFQDRRVYSMSRSEVLPESLKRITATGLRVGNVREVLLPFYFRGREISVAVIEVLPRNSPPARPVEAALQALPASAFRAQLLIDEPPVALLPGVRRIITVRITNASDVAWPARGDQEGRYQVNLASEWQRVNDTQPPRADTLAAFLLDLGPGESVEVPLRLHTPTEPGEYLLQLDMVQQHVGRFADRGSAPLQIKVQIGPSGK